MIYDFDTWVGKIWRRIYEGGRGAGMDGVSLGGVVDMAVEGALRRVCCVLYVPNLRPKILRESKIKIGRYRSSNSLARPFSKCFPSS